MIGQFLICSLFTQDPQAVVQGFGEKMVAGVQVGGGGGGGKGGGTTDPHDCDSTRVVYPVEQSTLLYVVATQTRVF